MRDYLVVGNWKMHGGTVHNAGLIDAIIAGTRLSGELSNPVKVLICPPFPYLQAISEKFAGTSLALGAQNVSEHPSGAYTGEVAAAMLRDVGCEYVIVGHSERRGLMGETNDIVAAKFAAALSQKLKPILCVGETLEQRESNNTEQVIDEQINAVLDTVGAESLANAVIAYEPVWAIGTGRTATPEQAEDVHRHIRQRVAARNADVAKAVQVLYGGSVKSANAAGLFSMPDIDGGLIGGACLKAAEFLEIVNAAQSAAAAGS